MVTFTKKYVTIIDRANGIKEKREISDIDKIYGTNGTSVILFKSDGKVFVEDAEAGDEYSCTFHVYAFGSWEKYCEWVQVKFLGRIMDEDDYLPS